MRHRGPLYRALDPLYAAEPLSGEGARRFGGRFNARGVPALYTSLSPHTAIREASQVGALQPLVLLRHDADIEPLSEATTPSAAASRAATWAMLSTSTWRDDATGGRVTPTQAFAQALIDDGFAGLAVPSFVRGAGPGDVNVVLFRWTDRLPTRLQVVDDEGRLPRRP